MANTSISGLSAGSSVAATDLFPGVQTVGVGPVKITADQLKTYVNSLTTGYIPFGAGSATFGSSANLFWDNSNVRLGIGTATPSYRLHLFRSTASSGTLIQRIENDNSGADTYISYAVASSPELLIGIAGAATNSYMFDRSTTRNLLIGTNNSERVRVTTAGNVLIGTTVAGASKLTVADNSIQINTAKTPASASDTGTTGQVCWDSNYVYVCVASNTWKRAAIATW